MLNNQETKWFLDFNKKVWPKRKNTKETIIDWRIFNNPYFTSFEKDLISVKDDKITGQIIPIYGKFISGEHSYNCVWGSDYMVDQEERGGNAGVKVLKTMIKTHLHFGVGMSDVSLKMHKVFREVEISKRYDFLFFAGKKQSRDVEYTTITNFIANFESTYSNVNTNSKNVNYFERSSHFFKWVLKKTATNKVTVAIDKISQGYVIFYNTSIKGIPTVKIIDYSANFINEEDALLSIINDYGAKTFNKLFFFSGTINLFKKVKGFRKRVFPIYSNAKVKKIEFQSENQLHVTGIDSDRFINSFL